MKDHEPVDIFKHITDPIDKINAEILFHQNLNKLYLNLLRFYPEDETSAIKNAIKKVNDTIQTLQAKL